MAYPHSVKELGGVGGNGEGRLVRRSCICAVRQQGSAVGERRLGRLCGQRWQVRAQVQAVLQMHSSQRLSAAQEKVAERLWVRATSTACL